MGAVASTAAAKLAFFPPTPPSYAVAVTMLIGDPINFDDILELDMKKGSDVPRRRLYDAVASRIGERLHELKVQVDTIAIEQEMQQQYHSSRSIE
ncbi:hypothetical protein Fmac_024679 [Flemingia macrophylla]|uniref:Uncharacterized protein n=1 Tax=Flemingia macrophylla TaxID=520843 RepID=A0ABD1LQ19_9FABA